MAEKYITKADVTNHLQEIQKDKFVNSDYKKFAWGMEIFIDTLPAADVEPVTHAEWEYDGADRRCSNCGAIVEEDEWFNHNWYYCYHCGAKMEEYKSDIT